MGYTIAMTLQRLLRARRSTVKPPCMPPASTDFCENLTSRHLRSFLSLFFGKWLCERKNMPETTIGVGCIRTLVGGAPYGTRYGIGVLGTTIYTVPSVSFTNRDLLASADFTQAAVQKLHTRGLGD
jgi:hypothetical protein